MAEEKDLQPTENEKSEEDKSIEPQLKEDTRDESKEIQALEIEDNDNPEESEKVKDSDMSEEPEGSQREAIEKPTEEEAPKLRASERTRSNVSALSKGKRPVTQSKPKATKSSSSSAKKPKKKKKNTKMSSARKNVWLIILACVLIVGSFIAFMPPQSTINQGLDIQGGLSVVLSAKNDDGSTVSDEDMEKSRAIIENRVNALGASEATVAIQGNNQILVQIPGLSDPQTALDTIGKTGKLEFARLDSFTDDDVVTKINNGEYANEGTVKDELTGLSLPSGETQHLKVESGTYTPLITGENITRVTVDKASETSSYYAVDLTLDSAGTNAFATATKELASSNGKIVIILDGEVQSAPAVQSEITGGQVSITGNYTIDEAKSLQTILESGSLPVSFHYEQAQVVGPTVGQTALYLGVIVALIGLILVMIYLLCFYKGLGIITAAAIAVFAILYLGILAILSRLGQFSLTMAGLAGVVLTIGMAADSSILTLERFREEIRMGKTVKAASISGVKHGILTSIDADVVSLVSALTLFFLASASVKGFGMTLALGICCDIVMMLVFKAPIIRLLAPGQIAKHPSFWGVKDCEEAAPFYRGDKQAESKADVKGRFIKRDFNILKYRKQFLMVAGAAIVVIAIIVGVRGMQFSIEFVGGSSVTFNNTGDVTTEQVRQAFNDAGESDPQIQTTETNGEPGFLVRTTTSSAEDASSVATQVANKFGWSTSDWEVTTIGPDWGTSVIRSSVTALLVAFVVIIAYIAIRFRDAKMGVVAVVTLIHDLAIVIGIYAILGQEFSPNTIAALLTILGYSLYDTVVVFHRINENMQGEGLKYTFATMANHSVNEVLVRSMNTSITSLIPVLAMLIFGGVTLRSFALPMVIGLVVGCYSSVLVATPLYTLWKTREPKFAKLVRKYGDDVQIFFLNRLELPAAQAVAEAAGEGEVSTVTAFAQKSSATKKPAKKQEPQKLTASQRRRMAQKQKQQDKPSDNEQ